jgi:hypothetical protein
MTGKPRGNPPLPDNLKKVGATICMFQPAWDNLDSLKEPRESRGEVVDRLIAAELKRQGRRK